MHIQYRCTVHKAEFVHLSYLIKNMYCTSGCSRLSTLIHHLPIWPPEVSKNPGLFSELLLDWLLLELLLDWVVKITLHRASCLDNEIQPFKGGVGEEVCTPISWYPRDPRTCIRSASDILRYFYSVSDIYVIAVIYECCYELNCAIDKWFIVETNSCPPCGRSASSWTSQSSQNANSQNSDSQHSTDSQHVGLLFSFYFLVLAPHLILIMYYFK